MRRRNSLELFWLRVKQTDACWLWLGTMRRDGYGVFSIDGVNRFAHRVSYELANGKIPDGLLIRHSCDNPACVRPSHLEIGTDADNVADRVRRHRSAIGEQSGRARLTEAQVIEIRSNLNITGTRYARQFGVDGSTVRLARRGKTWRHIQPTPSTKS